MSVERTEREKGEGKKVETAEGGGAEEEGEAKRRKERNK